MPERRSGPTEIIRSFINRVLYRRRLPVTPAVTSQADASDLTNQSVIPGQELTAAVHLADQQAQVELTPRQIEIRKNAQETVEALDRMPGKKALILVINHSKPRRDTTSGTFNKAANTRNIGYVVSPWERGEDGIYFYEAFRRNSQTPITVVLVLGREMANQEVPTQYERGIQIANKVSEISGNNKWEMPLIVSNSTDQHYNELLGKRFPGLIPWDDTNEDMLNSIDSHLK